MTGLLRWLLIVMGVACTAIGAVHLVAGVDSVPGEGLAGATVDSRERFYGAIFMGYGLAWIHVARQSPIPARAVRWLAGLLLLGGAGRLLSLLSHGSPHWFQVVLTGTELLLPPLFLWLATAGETERKGASTG
ncbi:DUF4345 domain-containing protein [Streptomyces sp. NPDC049555]|uniref:DUF4345 domain-containing protein n=1 Tax=Streptomyces sp. NPDC049555 TaxID=3154930 RepID=UPI003419687D